jgi:membrane carboxypeptidase/penicillin-binding protein PbpC
VYPLPAARFAIDPALHDDQEIMLEARGSSDRLTFLVDDRPLATLGAPFRVPWRLVPGTHRVRVVTADGARSELVSFEVR